MSEGSPTREIAERLALSPATVRTHVQSILRKLDVPSRAAALELVAGTVRSAIKR